MWREYQVRRGLYIYIHIHIHTHTHTRTHIYIYMYMYMVRRGGGTTGCLDLRPRFPRGVVVVGGKGGRLHLAGGVWQASDDAVLAESTPVPVNPTYCAHRRTRRLGRSGRDIRALRWAPDGPLAFGRDPSAQREADGKGTEYSSTRAGR